MTYFQGKCENCSQPTLFYDSTTEYNGFTHYEVECHTCGHVYTEREPVEEKEVAQ